MLTLEINKNTFKSILWVLCIIVIAVIFYFLKVSGAEPEPQSTQSNTLSTNISEDGDTQYVDISVRGGYRPGLTVASADKNTIVRMKTQNTYDCSLAVIIPALSYSNYLPQTGTTEIEIPPQAKGSEIRGSCSMGMYSFKIRFI